MLTLHLFHTGMGESYRVAMDFLSEMYGVCARGLYGFQP
jgi:hypothetical protein